MKLLFSILLLSISIQLLGQPVNLIEITEECKHYEINPKKLKLKLDPSVARLQLEEVKVEIGEPIFLTVSGCPNKLEVISKSGDISSLLENMIIKGYPKSNSLKLKIHIKQIKIRFNQLPSLSPRLYLSIDFFTEKASGGDYQLVYSTTESLPLLYNSYIEKPLRNLIRSTINDFYINRRYRHSLSTLNTPENPTSDLAKGIYTSFNDFLLNKPTYAPDIRIEADKSKNGLRSTFQLVEEKNGEKVLNPIFVFHDGEKLYLNTQHYYDGKYFVEMTDLNEDYFFIFDKIYDYGRAAATTVATGGGLLGALAGEVSATRKTPALLDKKTGTLIAFGKQKIRKTLREQPKLFQAYLAYIEQGDKEHLMELFQRLLEDENMKEKLVSELL